MTTPPGSPHRRVRPPSLQRRALLALGTAAVLAGCLGDDEVGLDPDDFDDHAHYLIASEVAATDLELLGFTRTVEGWVAVTFATDIDLPSYYGDFPRGMGTPPPDQPLPPSYLRAPDHGAIIDGYIEAIEADDASEGLRVTYEGGRCTSRFRLPRNRVEWYLNGTMDRLAVYADAMTTYAVECPD